jgi:ATP-dependent DNA ligase
MRSAEAAEIATDPLDWRPQLPRPSRRAPVIRDPIVEPAWEGTHVLAHVDTAGGRGPTIRLIDAFGEEATDGAPAIVEALGRAFLAVDAIIDGVLTGQATRRSEGAALFLEGQISPLTPILPRSAEVDVPGPRGRPEGPTAFVAVDLLRIDGQDLFDVPLLERKRLLESALEVEELVRVTPFARPPIETWLASWKAAGFGGVVVKAANSRYRPATLTDEWTIVTQLRR